MLRLTGIVAAAISLIASVHAGEAELRADVEVLAGQIGGRSVFQGDSLQRAADHIVHRFESLGWAARRLSYLVNGRSCENIEVERRGAVRPEEIVIVGAHYDTVPSTPGAGDNASGIAVLLALAETFAKSTPHRTMRFVAFANEEPIYFQTALMGSRVYAKGCRERGENIVAMVSLESVGFFSDEKGSQKYPFPLSLFYPSTANFIAVVGNRDSRKLVKQVSRSMAATKAIPIERAALPGDIEGVGWSDHWSFWQEGFQAVMVTDTAVFRNPHYHRPTDTPDTLDYARMTGVVAAMTAALNELGKTR
jgi:Zn-dependent M28 family amino/carboxypeptidase